MLWEYLKEHLLLTAIMVACLVVIIVIAIIALAQNKKAKKSAERAEQPKNVQPLEKKTETERDKQVLGERAVNESAQKPIQEPIEKPIQKEQEKQVEKEPTPPQPQAPQTPQTPQTSQQAQPRAKANVEKEEKAEKTEKAEKAQTAQGVQAQVEKNKKERNKTRENMNTMNLKDLKNVPTENEENFYDDEDENDKIARYSGKWVICRVVTANSKSADVIRSEEDDDEMYFFELRASNGEKLLTSEEYTTYSGAIGGIATHKNNIERGNFKITLSKKGDYIFKLLSGKNMLLCMGEHYATKARCESAIESAKRFAKTAIIDENIQDIVITPPVEDDSDVDDKVPDNGYNGKWIIRSNVAKDGEQVYFFELFASNGEKLLSSEEYTTYIGAINGIGTHKANIERGNFRVSLTKRGDYIYKLLNGNGQLLCLGEHYKTKRRCLNAVESVKRFAKNAPILSDQDTVNKNA